MTYNFYYVLSPCGTSILTNNAGADRRLIFKYANCKSESEIPVEDREILKNIIKNTKQALTQADIKIAKRMSAELNGILSLYNDVIVDRPDYHFLLCTDTFLGETTAQLVADWLNLHNDKLQVVTHRHTDLQTNDIDAFQLSLSELIQKLGEELPSFQQSGYKIIFNLTGGFKSVQGFLQSISNFYADETIYIFETSSNLLRIPRLPVRLDALEIVRENITAFRQIAMGIPGTGQHTISDIFLFTMDQQVVLSPWGELVWEQTKQQLYKDKLWPSPSKKIVYSDEFIKTVNRLFGDRIKKINERIDQLARHLESTASFNLNSLDYKALTGNPVPLATHEIDAWADQDAKRIFCYEEKGAVVLWRLDKGLH